MGKNQTDEFRGDLTIPDIAGRDVLPQLEAARRVPPELGAAATVYTMLGVESTLDSTREEREKLAQEGISSHPIGWGVAFYRREHRADV